MEYNNLKYSILKKAPPPKKKKDIKKNRKKIVSYRFASRSKINQSNSSN